MNIFTLVFLQPNQVPGLLGGVNGFDKQSSQCKHVTDRPNLSTVTQSQ